MSDNRTAANPLWVSLLAGLSGAVVALLLAPKRGQDTRQDLQQRAADFSRQARRNLDAAQNTAARKLYEARDLKDRLAAAVGETGQKAKQDLTQLKTASESTPNRQSPVINSWEEEV